jgi:hypothetical protein
MADFVPHPLVTCVARELGEKKVPALKADANAQAAYAKAQGDRNARLKWAEDDTKNATEKNDLATAFGTQATLPDLSLIAGYLGGTMTRDKATWRLFYLDARLDSWLLVAEDDIVVHQRLKDENAPSGVRDVLWVDATANLLRGSGPQTNDGRFLVGQLTRAGDFAASTGGGTFSAASGLLCEATTPGCCRVTRTRC